MVKVYLLSEGDYSDYHIVAAYSTKELAEKALLEYNRDVGEYSQGEIEEYELDSHTPITDCYHVLVNFEGEVKSVSREVAYSSEKPNRKITAYYAGGDFGKFKELQFAIPVDTKESAIKIALEKWTEVKAQAKWEDEEVLKAMGLSAY